MPNQFFLISCTFYAGTCPLICSMFSKTSNRTKSSAEKNTCPIPLPIRKAVYMAPAGKSSSDLNIWLPFWPLHYIHSDRSSAGKVTFSHPRGYFLRGQSGEVALSFWNGTIFLKWHWHERAAGLSWPLSQFIKAFCANSSQTDGTIMPKISEYLKYMHMGACHPIYGFLKNPKIKNFA